MNQTLDLEHTHTLGFVAYTHTPKPHQKEKLSPQARAVVLVGFLSCNSYKLYFAEDRNVSVSRCISFDEEGVMFSPDSPRSSHNNEI